MHPRGSFESDIERLEQNDPTLANYSLGFWASARDRTRLPTLATALRANTHLKKLDLSWTVINVAASWLGQAFSVNKGLFELDLRYAQFGCSDLFAMAVGINESRTLRNVYLCNHEPEDTADYQFEGSDIASIMHDRCVELGDDFNEQLALIAQDDSRIGSCLGHSLVLFCLSVELLDLGITNLSDLDVAYLSVAMTTNNIKLKKVVTNAQLSASQLKMLAAGLKHNHSIECLELSALSDEGMKHIAAMLRQSKTLTSLKLDDTAISKEANEVLLRALKNNHSLVKLEMNFNLALERGIITLFQNYLVRNRILKLNSQILKLDLMDSEGQGALSEAAFREVELAVAYFIEQNSSIELANQLPSILHSFKDLLSGKSIKLNLARLLVCDERVRSTFLHVYAQQLVVQGDFLLAIALCDENYISPGQYVLLVDAMLRDVGLSDSEEILTFKQQSQIGFMLLQGELLTKIDSNDMIMLRRLINLYNKNQKPDGVKELAGLIELTGAEYVVRLNEIYQVSRFISQSGGGLNVTAVDKIVGEADFQSLIARMRAEIGRLRADKVNIPDYALFLERCNSIRCYELIALSPGAGNNINAIIAAETRALRLKELNGALPARYRDFSDAAKLYLADVKEMVLSSLYKALMAIIDRAVDDYYIMPGSKNNEMPAHLRAALAAEPTQGSLAQLMRAPVDNVLRQRIVDEFRRDDLSLPLDESQMKDIIDQALKGIEFYSQLDRKSLFKSHLNMFSILFDNERGVLRANAYRRVLADPGRDINDKMAVLYALLKSNDGKKLQECVKSQIGFGDVVIDKIAEYLRLQAPDLNLEAVACDVFSAANTKPGQEVDLGLVATRSYVGSFKLS